MIRDMAQMVMWYGRTVNQPVTKTKSAEYLTPLNRRLPFKEMDVQVYEEIIMANSTGRFTDDTKEKLARRAAYTCSKPDCRKRTLIPAETSSIETIYKGEAAHIRGRRPSSARYDPSMTDEERASADNGIHLCVDHATEVDKNDGRDYPAYVLSRWKLIHDDWLRNQQKSHAERRRELNKYVSPYFTHEDIYPFDPGERASGEIFIPNDAATIPSRFVNVWSTIDKTVVGSTYWIAVSPQRSVELWWPQGECTFWEGDLWVVENVKLGREFPNGRDDMGRKFEIGLYETSPQAHGVFQEAKENDGPIKNLTRPFHPPDFVEMEAFLLWKISVTRIA